MIVIAWIVVIGVVLLCLALGGLVVFSARTARQVERKLPARGSFIDVDGARFHYIDEGSGPALVLIHGLAGQHGHFCYSLLDLLKKDHRVIILDRPGSGYSTRPPRASATIAAQAQMISRFIEALGIKRPLLVGHSLGGAIALALAANHPEQAGGLALIAPVTHRPGQLPPVFRGLTVRSTLLRHLVAWTLAIPLSIRNRHLVLESVFGPQPVPRDYATRGGGLLTLRPCSFVSASTDLMAVHYGQEDLTARYAGIKVPVGVIYGAEDRVLDPSAHCSALLRKLPDADCETIEGAGHMIPICSADRCAALIGRVAQRMAAADAALRAMRA